MSDEQVKRARWPWVIVVLCCLIFALVSCRVGFVQGIAAYDHYSFESADPARRDAFVTNLQKWATENGFVEDSNPKLKSQELAGFTFEPPNLRFFHRTITANAPESHMLLYWYARPNTPDEFSVVIKTFRFGTSSDFSKQETVSKGIIGEFDERFHLKKE